MKKDNLVYVQDIYDSIVKIEKYLGESEKLDLINNEMMKDAIIRHFEIIGEASSRLSSEYIDSYPDIPFRKAKDLRNLLIHEYDYVDVENVWLYVKKDLPPFKKQLAELLA